MHAGKGRKYVRILKITYECNQDLANTLKKIGKQEFDMHNVRRFTNLLEESIHEWSDVWVSHPMQRSIRKK